MNGRQFVAELKSRGVYRAAGIYAAGAWALLQVADVSFPIVGLGDDAIEIVLLAALVGFPITIVIAWIYDFTAQGIVETPPSPISERFTLSSTQIAEFAIIGILVLLVGYLYIDRLVLVEAPIQETLKGSTPSQRNASIAVLPLVNMSGNAEMEYFGDGLAEEILNLLARVESLDVAARTSSFYFKNKNVDIPTIGKHLDVSHVLEGSVRYQQDRVRVTIQLIKSVDGYHLWSETYERQLNDTFGLQDEIALQIVERLQVILTPASSEALLLERSVDPLAFDYYLRGRHYLRRLPDEVSLSDAEGMFLEAIAIDEDYANAHSGLCDTYLNRYQYQGSQDDFHQAEQACNRALTLNDRAYSVYVAMGNLYRTSGEYGRAHESFQKAIEISVNSIEAVTGLGKTLIAEGKLDAGEEALVRAVKLQSNYWPAQLEMANLRLNMGNTEEAIVYYERINSLLPDSGLVSNNLGAAYFLQGRFEDAIITWQETLKESVGSTVLTNLGSSFFFLRQFDKAAEMYSQARELAPGDHEVIGFLADAQQFEEPESELAKRNYQQALELGLGALEINPTNGETHAIVGHYLAHLGGNEEAEKHLRLASELAPDNMYAHYYSATAYAKLGDDQLALVSLQRAVELGYFKHLLRADAGLDSLRSSELFQQILH